MLGVLSELGMMRKQELPQGQVSVKNRKTGGAF